MAKENWDHIELTKEQEALYDAMLEASAKATELAGKLWDSLGVTDEESQRVTDSLLDQAHDVGGEVMAEDTLLRVEDLLQMREWAAEEAAEVERQAHSATPVPDNDNS